MNIWGPGKFQIDWQSIRKAVVALVAALSVVLAYSANEWLTGALSREDIFKALLDWKSFLIIFIPAALRLLKSWLSDYEKKYGPGNG